MRIKGKKFTYVQEFVRLPSGMRVRLEKVIHPGAVVLVPFLKPSLIVFIRQYRATLKKYIYELPAGTLEPGESRLACAKRELAEETSYQARRFMYKGFIYPVPGYSTEVIHIYAAYDLACAAAQKDDDELLEPVVLSRAQAQRMFREGKIVDGKTVCALTFCGVL